MSSPHAKTLEALGVEATARVTRIDSARWEEPDVGHGFTAEEPLEFFTRPENFITEPLALRTFEEATGGKVRRHREWGGVSYVEVPGGRLRAFGNTLSMDERSLAVDCRHGNVGIRIDLEWFTYILLFRKNEIEVVQLERVIELFADRAPVSAAMSSFLFLDLDVEAWLRAEVDARAALPSSWSRATAAGLGARLWRPLRATGMNVDTLRRLGTPASRATDWCASLDDDDRALLEHAVLQHATALLAGIEAATRAAEDESDDAAETVHDLLLQRDDAECVRTILPTQARAAVAVALEDVDREALVRLSALSAFAWPDDERLAAVLRREPDAWWGRFAEP